MMETKPRHLDADDGQDFWHQTEPWSYAQWGKMFGAFTGCIAAIMISVLMLAGDIPRTTPMDILAIIFIVALCGAICMWTIAVLTSDEP
jgi:hypothetical protein